MNWNGVVHEGGGFSWLCRSNHCLASLTATNVANLTLAELQHFAEEAHGWHQGYCNLCALAKTYEATLKNLQTNTNK